MVSSSGQAQRKILLVDSEQLVLQVYDKEMKRAGYRPLLAQTVEDALNLFERESPDGVVVDLGLVDAAGATGADLAEQVRTSALGRVVPVVGVSAGDKEIRDATDAVVAHGLDDYFEKPVAAEKLIWRLQELMDGRRVGTVFPDGTLPERPEIRVMVPRNTDFLQGSLTDGDLASLFFSFYAYRRSGKLLIMAGNRVRQISFLRGYPVFVESNLKDESFAQWLVGRGKVFAADAEATLTEWKDVNRSVGVLLVARGHLHARDLFDELRSQADHLVESTFEIREGNYYVEYMQDTNELDVPERIALHRKPANYVMGGLRNHYNRARCKNLFEGVKGPLEVAETSHFILRDLDNPSYFENLLEAVPGDVPAQELLTQAPFADNDDALAALTGLWVLGAVFERGSKAPKLTPKKKARRAKRLSKIKEAMAAAAQRAQATPEPPQPKPEKKRGIASIMSTLNSVSADVSYDSGTKALKSKDFSGAARYFEEAVSHSPDHPAYLKALGQSYLMMPSVGPEELQRAFQALRKATTLDPRDGGACHWLGVALLQMGHREEARVSLKRSIGLGSDHAAEAQSILATMP